MSRSKFEEWARKKGFDLDAWDGDFESLLTIAAYQAWLEGRELMREEAAQQCEDLAKSHKANTGECSAFDCDFVAAFETSANEIRKIEP